MAKADTKPTKAKPPRSPQLIVAVAIALLVFIATASLLNAQNRLLRDQQTIQPTPTPTNKPTPKPAYKIRPTSTPRPFPSVNKPKLPSHETSDTQDAITPTADNTLVNCPLSKDGQHKLELAECKTLIDEHNANLKQRQEAILKRNQEIQEENARKLAQYEADVLAYEEERKKLLAECLLWAESLKVESSIDYKNLSLAFPDAQIKPQGGNDTAQLRQREIERCHAYYGY